jgi:predicted YcjX-like family ATPase
VARHTLLQRQWDELMFLCQREKDYLTDQTHRVLVKVLTRRIDELARQMGFSEAQIQGRNFRAEKTDGRITSIVTE